MKTKEIKIGPYDKTKFTASIDPNGKNIIFSNGNSKELQQIKISTEKEPSTHLISEKNSIIFLSYNYNGTKIVARTGQAGDSSWSIIICDSLTFKIINIFNFIEPIPDVFEKFITMSTNDKKLAFTGFDEGIIVLDTETKKQIKLGKSNETFSAAQFSYCGQFLATYSFDKKIKIWDLENDDSTTIKTNDPKDAIYVTQAFSWNSQDTELISGSYKAFGGSNIQGQYNIRIWDLDLHQLKAYLPHHGAIDKLSLYQDNYLAAGNSRWFEDLAIWNIKNNKLIHNQPETILVATSPCGKYILCANQKQYKSGIVELITID